MSNPKIDSAGTKRWYNADGQLCRVDGPAVEYADGYKAWYVNGQLHRLDGPAVEWANGYKAWWVNGKELTEAEHYAQTCVYQFIMSKPYSDTVETAS